MFIEDLGVMHYREAWRRQEEAHQAVLDGGDERLILVEHPPVITFGRRDGGEQHLRASQEAIAQRGVELVKSDRGGDITLHAPGQLVAYPIVRLIDHRLSVSGYVHLLERIVIAALADLGVTAFADPKAVGVWVNTGPEAAKVCAIGVRIRRGVSLHGLALNVSTDLSLFDLIVPCGLTGRKVTSLARLLPERPPAMMRVKLGLIEQFRTAFGAGAGG